MVFHLCLDIGTTNVKCAICDTSNSNRVIKIVYEKLNILYLEHGGVEINPDELWNQILDLIKQCVQTASLSINQISAIGISAQRNTFVTWNKTTGKEFHNLIVWNDLRANSMVQEYNKSWMIWGLNIGSKILHFVTREKRFLAGSVLKIMNAQISPRLAWVLRNEKTVQDHLARQNVLYGTLDSWLIYKFTCGSHHVSDVSHVSVSGMYDPFTCDWAGWALSMFQIPRDILPRIVSTVGDGFGSMHKSWLGQEIPILCSIADQSASLYGLDCRQPGDMKLTLGTGSFLDVHTGCEPHPSLAGLYPLVAWSDGRSESRRNIYLVEGASYDTGTLIEWGRAIGLYENVEDTSDLANSVKNSGGVVFCPAFRGLQAPVNDPTATAGFLGVSANTCRAHLVRALLESVAFRARQLYQTVREETGQTFKQIRVDGGASRNDFLCQLIADLTQLTVERSEHAETSILGVVGLMSRKDCSLNEEHPKGRDVSGGTELGEIESSATRVDFTPSWAGHENGLPAFEKWKAALSRFQHWS